MRERSTSKKLMAVPLEIELWKKLESKFGKEGLTNVDIMTAALESSVKDVVLTVKMQEECEAYRREQYQKRMANRLKKVA